MIGRVVLVLVGITLLASLLIALELPPPASAQDPLPTPAGRLGGRMPLPTAEGLLGDEAPRQTPTPARHPLAGTWLFSFAEPDQAPAQAVFADDGLVMFTDAAGKRGAGVWIPDGQQSGVMAVVVREADAPGQSPRITILQGSIDVDAQGDTATLVYAVETVEGGESTAERAGPFMATGQRMDEQLIVPTPE
jgi:hypothetical protein